MKKGSYETEKEETEIRYGERRVFAEICQPKKPGRYPAVILSHGYNGSGSDFAMESEYFASYGFLTLAIDFCGGSSRSRSSGVSTEMSVVTETEDLLAVLDAVKKMPQADAEHIFLFGGSQGGLVSSLAAARREQDVRGLVMYYPAFCIPDDWRKKYPDPEQLPGTVEFWNLTLGERYIRDACALDAYAAAAPYRREILIIHGDSDEVVPVDYSLRLQKTCENARLLILPREAHGYTPEGTAEAAEAALMFLQRLCGNGQKAS